MAIILDADRVLLVRISRTLLGGSSQVRAAGANPRLQVVHWKQHAATEPNRLAPLIRHEQLPAKVTHVIAQLVEGRRAHALIALFSSY
jgi:hypothetical protein